VRGLGDVCAQVERIAVRHATRSKKVDVKELKHHIWTDLATLQVEPATGAEEAAPAPASSQRAFSEVVARVEEEHSDEQEGVTCSYYFICVLHLANEHGLKLEGRADLSDFAITDDRQAHA
jgi:condensin complex subunit 2